jgi:hypothetical protein
MSKHVLIATAVLCLPGSALAPTASAQPLTTAFTYQGRLADGGLPVAGPFDFRFIAYDAPVGGAQVGLTAFREDVPVADGVFSVFLDFGPIFTGSRRYLEVAVRPGASTATHTILAPRQELSAAPNATFAVSSGVTPWTGVTNKPLGFLDNVDNDVLGGLSCGSQQIARWTGSAWACSADQDSGGDITQVSPGPGLTGGGSSGAVSLGVNFGGLGTSTTVARGDHTHVGQSWNVAGTGLQILNSADFGRALAGFSTATTGNPWGVYGNSAGPTGRGLYGLAIATLGENYGVYARTESINGYGLYAAAEGVAFAGYFDGRAHVNGLFSKSAGAFKIDHPLDPERKYLYHSFVESPDMKNVYDGIVVLDASGEATVELPDWFEALNRDFRYLLTAIGGAAPGLHVTLEMSANRFRIGGGPAGLKVSWQVTGIRHDPFADKNRIPLEEDKPADEVGTFLHPEAHGAPRERGLAARHRAGDER